MSARLRGRFSVGRVVAALALVVALVAISVPAIGKTSSNGPKADSDASASATGKRGPRGKRGKTGKTGPQGPAGPAGARGLQGPAGPKGATGATGAAGAQGPQGIQGPPGAQGLKGDTGEQGEPGDPWTAGGTLPDGETMTGAWSAGMVGNGLTSFAAVSFPLPLESAPQPRVIPVGGGGDDAAFCPGTASNPQALPGNVCIYQAQMVNVEVFDSFDVFGADAAGPSSVSGVVIGVTATDDPGFAWGSYAVTAPSGP